MVADVGGVCRRGEGSDGCCDVVVEGCRGGAGWGGSGCCHGGAGSGGASVRVVMMGWRCIASETVDWIDRVTGNIFGSAGKSRRKTFSAAAAAGRRWWPADGWLVGRERN
nr:hypothetical protein [Tanacetum cinerariifolium]